MSVIRKSMELSGRTLTLETGRMAKQANGSVLLTYGENVILATATGEKQPREGQGFFPLTVDFIPKMYASGKIPGGFFKRESKPPVSSILIAREIDRGLRPLFPDGFKNAVHVVLTVLSYDEDADLGSLGSIAASAALTISDIPFAGPIAGAFVCKKDDDFVVFPNKEQMENSKLELSVSGTYENVNMVESGAWELSEEEILDAIYLAHEKIQEIVEFQKEFAKDCSKPKFSFEVHELNQQALAFVKDNFYEKIKKANEITEKLPKYEALDNLRTELAEAMQDKLSEEEIAENGADYKAAFEKYLKEIVRDLILAGCRPDGRDLDEIRPITVEKDILPRVHGSALFTRGETQSLGVITLGSPRDEQMIDDLREKHYKNYFLHYNFPPYSVGEAGFMRAPGRRELGHGHLAERSLYAVMPSGEEFPYTIRAVSEILESNGSSSMASVCSCSTAMMAAGVPIKKPVAGIANGLVMDGENFVILTDIQGMEDHLGDMDFKVTGTDQGITAIQMDIKIKGITKEIMKLALEKAKIARLHILGKITECIAEPSKELSKYAPKIESIMIDKDKISQVIGSGGKTIKEIIEVTGADINIDDDGRVSVASPDAEALSKAMSIVKNIVEDPEQNGIYEGEVTRVEAYGAFVKFMYNKQGMVHVSKMDKVRVGDPADLVAVGDKVKVRFVGFKEGKISLAMDGIEGNPTLKSKGIEPSKRPERSAGDRRDGNDRRDRRDGRDRRPRRDYKKRDDK